MKFKGKLQNEFYQWINIYFDQFFVYQLKFDQEIILQFLPFSFQLNNDRFHFEKKFKFYSNYLYM